MRKYDKFPTVPILLTAAAITTISYLSDLRTARFEKLCPGPLSVAPNETTNIAIGDSTLHLYNRPVYLGPDHLSVSITSNVGGRTSFGDTFDVDVSETTELSQLGWQGRGTSNQSVQSVGTATQDENGCVTVTLNE